MSNLVASPERNTQGRHEQEIQELVQQFKQAAKKCQLRVGVSVILVFLLFAALYQVSGDIKVGIGGFLIVIAVWGLVNYSKLTRTIGVIEEFDNSKSQLELCLASEALDDCMKFENTLLEFCCNEKSLLLNIFSERYLPEVASHIKKLEYKQYKQDLNKSYQDTKSKLEMVHNQRVINHPLCQVKAKLSSTLDKLKKRRENLQDKWDATYETLSWWNKIKYADGPNFSGLDSDIKEVEKLNFKFDIKHGKNLERVKLGYDAQNLKAEKRLKHQFNEAMRFIQIKYVQEKVILSTDSNQLLRTVGWASAFGLSYSLWDDFTTTGQVYDALRNVNGNFKDMGDTEVWFETLWMSEESLAGLANLTKGAYFEQLTANDTQGELFEHFNNPDSDIIIDGIAYQLKATDSESYINSVAPAIPVIATSEVAELTDAIDSGVSNTELTANVDMAINGMGFDAGDSMADGILSGLGGLGFFATLRGINHAAEKYNKGGNGEEAIFEGITVAVEGTAKAMVDASEMLYKAATSRPSRAVGRGMIKVLKKLDEKMEQDKN